ncbi:hypothetical protein QKW60_05520 [Defluviimonas aestuarii]|uniref:hypothetical protein n=1 Tax=Albidovulum aestuarii TaxID=1130726 RepID=UPI00249A29B3|nr:hypothetical protein [Defluviimonas aestuarii]MDI3335855.1 hypothetical protein [Defluviimonas aestuarii]
MSNRPAIYITQGTVGRAWALQLLTDAGTPVDLTGVTGVTFSMVPRGSTTRKVDNQAGVLGAGTYTLPDGSSQTFAATDGVLIYQPVAGDVDTPGEFLGEFTYQVGGQPVVDPGYSHLEIHIKPAI